ncbi:MAG: hypothetical protein P1R58_05285 [bacterium]|nr:hypothetical protein [bacterium]
MSQSSKKSVPVDLTRVSTYSIAKRKNKTSIESFGEPLGGDGASRFLESLPKFLKAADFKEFIDLVYESRSQGKPFHLCLGAHTIKVGLSPILIDLMKLEIVTGLSFNGAGLIHDLELAFWGGTSEDVQAGLSDGSFGMVKETSRHYAAATRVASEEGIGFGEAGGKYINREKAEYRELSVFATAASLELPITVHVGIGTDIVAQHPDFDAAAVAAASHLDFRILSEICMRLDQGGTLANIGSAVILPEVFLKALTVARNLQPQKKSRLTTANFDMITHYRPTENIVSRPTYRVGRGFNFVGHHEIMVPLLAWALKSRFGY